MTEIAARGPDERGLLDRDRTTRRTGFGAGPSAQGADEVGPSPHTFGGVVQQSSGAILMMFWIALATAGAVWWLFEPYAVFVTLGAASCIIVTVPAFQGRMALLSPWTLVMIEIYIGGGLRGIFLSLQIDTADNALERLFMQGQSPEYFVRPGVFYVLAIGVMTAAYLMRPRRQRTTKRGDFLAGYDFKRSVVPIAMMMAAVGATGFVLYLAQTGGLDLSTFSQKKRSISGSSIGADYKSFGAYEFLNRASAAAFWIMVAYYAKSGRTFGLRSARGWLLLAFALNAIVMPVYVSSRTTAVGILIVGAGISLAVRPRQIPLRRIVVGAVTVLVLISLMTFLRANSRTSDESAFGAAALSDATANALIYNRNFGDMETAARIIHNVPDVVPYQNGKPIAGWLLAPIPRAIWPTKPVINVGPLIGYEIFGTRGSGIPPGFVGDLFLNFGYLGVLGGALILGWLLLAIDQWRARQRAPSAGFLIVYVPVAFSAGLSAISKGLGALFYTSGIQVLPLLLAVAVVGVWGTTKQPADDS